MQDFSRYDQKLEFILRTAARIFAEKNYHSTSMRDIARATEVSLSAWSSVWQAPMSRNKSCKFLSRTI